MTEADKGTAVNMAFLDALAFLDRLIDVSETLGQKPTECQQAFLQNRLDRLSGKLLEGLGRKAA